MLKGCFGIWKISLDKYRTAIVQYRKLTCRCYLFEFQI